MMYVQKFYYTLSMIQRNYLTMRLQNHFLNYLTMPNIVEVFTTINIKVKLVRLASLSNDHNHSSNII